MKRKWNWLDTVIVAVIAVLVIGVCAIMFWPKNDAGEVITAKDSTIFVTFDTAKAKDGTYDALTVGDEIMTSDNGKVFGVIEKIEYLPHQSSVFNEETKQYDVFENEEYPFCRFTVKTTGYFTDRKEAYAKDRQLCYGESWNLETTYMTVSGTISGIEGGESDE